MHLTLDAIQMRACMALWRGALAFPRPGSGSAQKDQEATLAHVRATVAGWCDLLRLCRADAGEQAALQDLCAEVQRFKAWIEDAAVATKLARGVEQLDRHQLTGTRPTPE